MPQPFVEVSDCISGIARASPASSASVTAARLLSQPALAARRSMRTRVGFRASSFTSGLARLLPALTRVFSLTSFLSVHSA